MTLLTTDLSARPDCGAPTDGEGALLLALNRLLNPQWYAVGASPLRWDSEILDELGEMVDDAALARGLVPHVPMWAQIASQWTTKEPGQRYDKSLYSRTVTR